MDSMPATTFSRTRSTRLNHQDRLGSSISSSTNFGLGKLSKLPREIRDNIYQQIFGQCVEVVFEVDVGQHASELTFKRPDGAVTKPWRPTRRSICPACYVYRNWKSHVNWIWKFITRPPRSSLTSLSCTSKQISEESRLIFFEVAHFKFRFAQPRYLPGKSDSLDIEALLPSIRSFAITDEKSDDWLKTHSWFHAVRSSLIKPHWAEQPLEAVVVQLKGKGATARCDVPARPHPSEQSGQSAKETSELVKDLQGIMAEEEMMEGLQREGLLKMVECFSRALRRAGIWY
ncbi:hypothetical protein LTR85_009024 [Meristemomyces frigidus]|nr:hypothetical protein LTR85_009024 [Meristemomyces frigidus]